VLGVGTLAAAALRSQTSQTSVTDFGPDRFSSASTQNSSESEVRRLKFGLRIYIEIIYNLNLLALKRTVIRLIKFDYHYSLYND